MPDYITGRFQADGVRVPRTAGNRSSSWSLLFWISASGKTIPPLFVFPEELKSRTAEITDVILRKGVPCRTAFEPSGYMNGTTFETELLEAFPLLRQDMLPHEAGLIIFDNHVSHISRKTEAIARWFGFHVVTLPSHLSMLLQPLDNHFNLSFQRKYQQLYSVTWSHCASASRTITLQDKVRAVVEAYSYVAANDVDQITKSW